MMKLAAVHSDLHEWDRTVLKAPQKKIKELTKELEVLLSGPMTDDTDHKQREVTRQIEVALEQEEVHYMQRSRANWLMHGDKNTAFFHNYAKVRRKRNTILKLKDGNEEWIEGNDAMGNLIHEYFSSLFSSKVQQTDGELLNRVIPRVTSEMNASLLKPYTAEEVKEAMFSIGDFKAPGTDGLHAVFYKKFWFVVGDEVTREVLQVLNSGVIPREWNETAIVLIPKVESLELVSQFRPISLYNSKGSGMRYLGSGTCVEWNFLQDMMIRLGFDQTWVNLIMSCVTSVNYRVWFNVVETESFTPTRGLDRGIRCRHICFCYVLRVCLAF
jgi:hypothetical protein